MKPKKKNAGFSLHPAMVPRRTKVTAHRRARKASHRSSPLMGVRMSQAERLREDKLLREIAKLGRRERNTTMAQRRRNYWEERIVSGSRIAIITANEAGGPYSVRLYVNGGETATLSTGKAKTIIGARKIARKLLTRNPMATKKKARKRRQPAALTKYWAKKRKKKRNSTQAQRQARKQKRWATKGVSPGAFGRYYRAIKSSSKYYPKKKNKRTVRRRNVRKHIRLNLTLSPKNKRVLARFLSRATGRRVKVQ